LHPTPKKLNNELKEGKHEEEMWFSLSFKVTIYGLKYKLFSLLWVYHAYGSLYTQSCIYCIKCAQTVRNDRLSEVYQGSCMWTMQTFPSIDTSYLTKKLSREDRVKTNRLCKMCILGKRKKNYCIWSEQEKLAMSQE